MHIGYESLRCVQIEVMWSAYRVTDNDDKSNQIVVTEEKFNRN